MMRRVAVAIVALSLYFANSTPLIAAIKAGGSCSKLGQTFVQSNSRFTCTKSGKKLIWKKSSITSIAAPKPKISATPISPTPAPSATVMPSTSPTPSIVNDYLDFRRTIIYGIQGVELTRRADSGVFFNTDSRSTSTFSSIRQKAYLELNKDTGNKSHPNIEFIYFVTPNFPSILVNFYKKELDEAAALWNDYFNGKFRVNIYMVTEKDREYVKTNSWLQRNLAAVSNAPGQKAEFDRLEDRSQRPFVGGGAGFWKSNSGEWMGNLYLSTASWIDLNFINYEWPQTAKHEFVHIVQDYAFYKNLQDRPRELHELVQPIHFREGGANAISYLSGFSNIGWSSDAMDWNFWMLTRDSKSWRTIKNETDAISLMKAMECLKTCEKPTADNPGQAFFWAYSYGAVMYEWVLGTYGFEGYKRMLDRLVTATTFEEVTQGAFSLSKDDFYAKIAPYIVENIARTKPYE